MAHGVLHLDLGEDGIVVERNEERVPYGTFGRVVVVDGETFVLNAVDLGA
jgi:hypothetical protein